jgi:hypothetical protein
LDEIILHSVAVATQDIEAELQSERRSRANKLFVHPVACEEVYKAVDLVRSALVLISCSFHSTLLLPARLQLVLCGFVLVNLLRCLQVSRTFRCKNRCLHLRCVSPLSLCLLTLLLLLLLSLLLLQLSLILESGTASLLG